MASVSSMIESEEAVWWLLAGALLLVLGYVVYNFIGMFVLGLFAYYATRPIHVRLNPYIPLDTVGTITSLLLVAFPVLVLLAYTLYIAALEIMAAASDADALVPYLEPYVDTALIENPQLVYEQLQESPAKTVEQFLELPVQSAVDQLIGVLAQILNIGLILFVALTIAFYLLRDGPRFADWFSTHVASKESLGYRYFKAVDTELQYVYFGNVLFAVTNGIVAVITYNALNAIAPAGIAVPYPTLLGLLTGVGSLVPVVGMKIVYVPVGLLLAARAALVDPAIVWFPVLFLTLAVVLVDTIPEIILRPYISGRHLHTGLVLFAYLFGPLLFGWYGLFLGPLLIVLVVQFAKIVLPEISDRSQHPLDAPDAQTASGGAQSELPAEDAETDSAG